VYAKEKISESLSLAVKDHFENNLFAVKRVELVAW
jgi:hypothetical protein